MKHRPLVDNINVLLIFYLILSAERTKRSSAFMDLIAIISRINATIGNIKIAFKDVSVANTASFEYHQYINAIG